MSGRAIDSEILSLTPLLFDSHRNYFVYITSVD